MTNGILIVNGIPLIVNGTHFRSKNENEIICGEWNLSNGEKSFRSVWDHDYIEERILPDADALAGIAMPTWVSTFNSA